MGFTQTIFLTKRYGGFTKKKHLFPKKLAEKKFITQEGRKNNLFPTNAFLKLLFGCHTANFGPLLRGKPNLMLITVYIFTHFILFVTGSLVTRLGPKACQAPSRVQTSTFQFLAHQAFLPNYQGSIFCLSLIFHCEAWSYKYQKMKAYKNYVWKEHTVKKFPLSYTSLKAISL